MTIMTQGCLAEDEMVGSSTPRSARMTKMMSQMKTELKVEGVSWTIFVLCSVDKDQKRFLLQAEIRHQTRPMLDADQEQWMLRYLMIFL
nr:hypothetical protein PsAHV6-045 [Psittacid alphaherpesvirus 6]